MSSAVVVPIVPPASASKIGMSPHKAMQDFIKIRNARAELAKKDKLMKQAQDNIAQALLAMSKDQDVTGFKGEDCLCYQQERRLYSVKDASAFFSWILEYGHVDALDKAVNSDFATAYMKENEGELPPGVHVERKLVMHVRTSGGKA